jgi:hypothetical protein
MIAKYSVGQSKVSTSEQSAREPSTTTSAPERAADSNNTLRRLA